MRSISTLSIIPYFMYFEKVVCKFVYLYEVSRIWPFSILFYLKYFKIMFRRSFVHDKVVIYFRFKKAFIVFVETNLV